MATSAVVSSESCEVLLCLLLFFFPKQTKLQINYLLHDHSLKIPCGGPIVTFILGVAGSGTTTLARSIETLLLEARDVRTPERTSPAMFEPLFFEAPFWTPKTMLKAKFGDDKKKGKTRREMIGRTLRAASSLQARVGQHALSVQIPSELS